ncbi:MAG: putative sulfate exporter family transporter [Candidatus Sericytochromatia bacterium]|nr:putative sulfate exporter family transporter [Candidatus Sericytochromatia bacterium]
MNRLPSWLPGLGLALLLAVASTMLAWLPGLKVMGALTVALLVGMAWRAAAGLPPVLVPGTRLAARTVLRAGIVLMGARLDFALVAQAGPRILLLDLLVIVVGIAGISWLARRFGVPDRLGVLLAVGTSICGASAVVAAAPIRKADEEETSLAVALCGILGTVGVLFFVLVGPLLGLTQMQLAVLSGSTLHEVAQVMAAAFTWGPQTGDMGTLVKLTRVVMLAPTLLVLAWLGREPGTEGTLRWSWKEPPVPWFVIGFLAIGALGSVGLVPLEVKESVAKVSVFLMVTAMAAMGLNTQLAAVRRAGMKVILAGLLGFFALVAMGWLLINGLGIAA